MKRLWRAIGLGLLVWGLGVLLTLTPLGTLMERSLGLPWLYGLRGAKESPPHVAVVGINGGTGSALGLPALPRDWPREVHGELVRRLVEYGAAVIVFDIFFATPKEADSDRQFIEALREARRVVLFERLTGKTQPVLDASGEVIGEVWAESLVRPFAPLPEVASALGVFPLPKLDASVFEFWTFKDSVSYEPSLPAAALQLYAAGRQPDWASWLHPGADGGTPEDVGATMRALRMRYLEAAPAALPASAPPLLGALDALYRGDEHRYLNFYGPPGTIRNIPYQNVLQAQPGAAPDLRDTVVFVGYSDLYDPGQPDRFYTVYTRDDGVDLAGVEIAATAFANLLSDESLAPLGLWPTLALLGVFALLVSLAAALLPALWGVSACALLWLGYGLLAQWQFAAAQWWPVVLPLLVLAPLALFLGVFGQYRFERSRGLRISEAINYYLPEHIAREFAAGTLTTEATNNVSYGTCFATDMAGFSAIAEGMAPAELASFLNEYFEVLAGALRTQQVDVTEFRADAIMCAWLGVEQDSDLRRRALRAALAARDVIAGFGEQHGSALGRLRVGLESGWFYVGHSGGGGHFVYSIVGDCANTASRLEGLNKYLGTQIIASRAVVEGLDDFLLRPLGLFRLKGRDSPIEVVEVLDEAGEGNPGEPPWLPLFASALSAFQAERTEEARAGFERVLVLRPADGPSEFFLARCAAVAPSSGAPDEAGAPRMVVMEDK